MSRCARESTFVLLLLLWGSSGLAACGPGFDPASFIERPRLVGAEVRVEGAPGRATPLPGDEVTLEPWLLQPEVPSPVRASYVVCAATDVRRGAAGCRAMPLAFVPATPPSESLPPVAFTVPSEAELAGASQLLVLVASCDRSALPSLDASTFLPTCDDPMARAELTTLQIPLAFDAMLANHHPTLLDEAFTVDAGSWSPRTESPPASCALAEPDETLPRVVIPSDAAPPDAMEPFAVTLTFTTDEDDRETYGSAASPLRESLQISHYVTHGQMERSFSAVDAMSDPSMPVAIDWIPPAFVDVPEAGAVVRFTWIARDLRGGFARADRALCLVRGS